MSKNPLEDLQLIASWFDPHVRSDNDTQFIARAVKWALARIHERDAEVQRLRAEVKTLRNVRVISSEDLDSDKSFGKFPEGYNNEEGT